MEWRRAMGPRHPITLYRPSKADSGRGTFTETLADGRTIYGTIEVHDAETMLIVSRFTDVLPEDQIVADGALYRVSGSFWTMQATHKRIPLVRIERPIVPRTYTTPES
jgi:hypothetical protein